MSFPQYPDAARRVLILQAHLLQQQGLSYRQIGERMDKSISTVHGYLRDFEEFRTDLIADLAVNRIVGHLLQLSDLEDPHHGQRLVDIRELRLLLTALPTIRRGELERTGDLLQSGVAVDRYGNRYPKPDLLHEPTPEELARIEQLAQLEPPPAVPEPDQPLAFLPEPTRTQPNGAEQEIRRNSAHDGESPELTRTQPNGLEQEIPRNPAHDGNLPEPSRTQPNGAERQSPLPRNAGRNKPCPCNSGKKRKHCHPQSLPQAESQARAGPARSR